MAFILLRILVGVLALTTSGSCTPKAIAEGVEPVVNASPSSCTSYKIPVTITTESLIYNGSEFKDNFDVVEFTTQFSRKSPYGGSSIVVFSGKMNVTETYEIAATFCSPKTLTGGHEKSILLATHGFFHDGRYWNSQYNPSKYSFVDYMTSQGFSVFFYDRLGTGQSQKISGYLNQIGIAEDILSELTKVLRTGEYTPSIGKPESIVLVGHAYGSYTSQDLITTRPNIVDGEFLIKVPEDNPEVAIESLKVSLEAYAPRIAKTIRPQDFDSFDTGYLFFADIYNHVNTYAVHFLPYHALGCARLTGDIHRFFAAPDFEIEVAEYAQSIAQPFGIAEYMSRIASPAKPNYFSGPVLIAAGEFGFVNCGGNCESTFNQGIASKIFLGTNTLKTYIHPGSGHALNFHKNATGLYSVITDFLTENGF
ncbi:MAG: hypothetical protein Q9186_004800 [Xanthomendoza sp. 1 TL-2023]